MTDFPLAWSLARTLHTLRRDRRLRLREVAPRAGVSLGHLSAVERANAMPSLPVLYRLVDVYGITLGRLFELVEAHRAQITGTQ